LDRVGSHTTRSLIADCLGADAEIIGPGYRLRGHRAVEAEVARFLKNEPGVRLALTSGFDSHDGWVRFTFELLDPSDHTVNQGWDLVHLQADGKIGQVITFWGSLPPPPENLPKQLLPPHREDAR